MVAKDTHDKLGITVESCEGSTAVLHALDGGTVDSQKAQQEIEGCNNGR